ncbi:C3orf85 isoform 4, partial [Pan troglodytes]
ALGAPFLLEDPANQFLRLKRHVNLQDYWDPDHSSDVLVKHGLL